MPNRSPDEQASSVEPFPLPGPWQPSRRLTLPWAALLFTLFCALLLLSAGCLPVDRGEVVAYVSLDEPYARPVLQAFTLQTGIRVLPVYDTEASKSRGLAQRILAERQYPRADVFWSSEVLQTLVLQQAGVLQPYFSPSAAGIPARYKDPQGFWTGFAARFRIIIYNSSRCQAPPQSVLSLTQPRWRAKVAMANPLFGTTTTEAAALFQVLGARRARDYYRTRRTNQTRIVESNSAAAEQTARGEVVAAQTDTDDAFIRMDRGDPVGIVFPDQKGVGALLIPDTTALIRGAPHAQWARRFLDFLLRPETELILANLPSRQLPLHSHLESRLPPEVRALLAIRPMAVDYNRLIDGYPEVDGFLRGVFIP